MLASTDTNETKSSTVTPSPLYPSKEGLPNETKTHIGKARSEGQNFELHNNYKQAIKPQTKASPEPKEEAKETDLFSLIQAPSIPKNEKEDKSLFKTISNFISSKGVFFTTFVATALNVISAPIRALNIESPLKSLLNKASMFASKAHLLTYAFSGIESARDENNPILLFSFFLEGVSACISNVRNLYLMRGIATALDALPSAFEDHSIGRKFSSYGECFTKSMATWKTIIKEFFEDPTVVFTKNKGHLLGISSIITIIGSILGLTVNDKLGTIRDISGALGDVGLAMKKNKTIKASGFSYLFGSFMDGIARIFSRSTAKFFSDDLGQTFENIRNTFHEFAIALDRLGQYLFLRYNQEVAGKSFNNFEIPDELKKVGVS